ncbi:putative spermidine/putrescine transport system permease protein [Roseomonas rosea]|jgi:ABC-type spermidine/putrescine transport system permease subunit II|uniref:Putative spermidine/putrescine transport system permease protein n=1 Tax=Muricoccus roseus TaxID=198092 RepID=A0A1M6AIR7_9PROT|nr:ABC transporter permease [Roseomonas rosea]SHI36399.1 putative spermidine/putrescine transport system permease protein [Roseomonas rosea]
MMGPVLRATLLRALVVLLCFGLLAPIVIVAIASFSGDGYLKFPPESFSTRWYERFLGDPRWRQAIANSLMIGVLASFLSTMLGFLAAYAMVRGQFPFKRVIAALLLTPVIVPHVITAVAIYFLSARLGLVGARPWIAVAHSVVALPVVLVILQSALRTVDPALERAAMVFGCTRWGVFRRVVLPLALPGVVSAALFSFLTSFDELVISIFLAGFRSETLPVRIWNSLLLEVEPTIAAVSTLLIAVTTLALAIDALLRRLRGGGGLPAR